MVDSKVTPSSSEDVLDYEIVHNVAREQWEMQLADGRVIGYLAYEVNDSEIYVTSVHIHADFGGRGLATELTRVALQHELDLGAHKIVAICPFVQAFLRKHPEYRN